MNNKITVLAVVMAVLVSGVVAVAAVPSSTAANAVDSHEISECTVIDEPGEYELTQNLTTDGSCLNIDVANVTIDGNGYTIEGTGDAHTGITADEENTTITNVTVTGFKFGVTFNGDYSTLADSTVVDNEDGVTVHYAGAVNVTNTTVSGNGNAFWFEEAGHVPDIITIRNSTVVDNDQLIVEHNSEWEFVDSTVERNGDDTSDDDQSDDNQDEDDQNDNEGDDQNDGEQDDKNDDEQDNNDQNGEDDSERSSDGTAYQFDVAVGEVIDDLGDDEDAFYGTQGRLVRAQTVAANGTVTGHFMAPSEDYADATDGCEVYGSTVDYDSDNGTVTATLSHTGDADCGNVTMTFAAYELPGDDVTFVREHADDQELVSHRTVTLEPGEEVEITLDLGE